MATSPDHACMNCAGVQLGGVPAYGHWTWETCSFCGLENLSMQVSASPPLLNKLRERRVDSGLKKAQH